MSNGSERIPEEILPSDVTVEELQEKLEGFPNKSSNVVPYPSAWANLQQCTNCNMLLTIRATKCPVCNA